MFYNWDLENVYWREAMSSPFLLLHTGQFPKHNNNRIIKLHEMFIHNIPSFSDLKETNIFSLIFSNKNHWKNFDDVEYSILYYH